MGLGEVFDDENARDGNQRRIATHCGETLTKDQWLKGDYAFQKNSWE